MTLMMTNEEFLAYLEGKIPGEVLEECVRFVDRHPGHRLCKLEELDDRCVVTIEDPQEGGRVTISRTIPKP